MGAKAKSTAGSPALTFKAGGKKKNKSGPRKRNSENGIIASSATRSGSDDNQSDHGNHNANKQIIMQPTPLLASSSNILSVIQTGIAHKRSPFQLKSWIACVLTLDGRDKFTKVSPEHLLCNTHISFVEFDECNCSHTDLLCSMILIGAAIRLAAAMLVLCRTCQTDNNRQHRRHIKFIEQQFFIAPNKCTQQPPPTTTILLNNLQTFPLPLHIPRDVPKGISDGSIHHRVR